MRQRKLLSIVAIVGLSLSAGTAAVAQTNQQPSEFPATSYKGKQYVDSKGCVFIRAGIDGNVTWVPRMTRDRKVVCGFKPTGGSNVASAVASAEAPLQITLNESPAPVAKPAPKRVKKAVPVKPRMVKPVVVRQTAPAPRVVPAPKVAAAAPVVRTTTATSQSPCRGSSALSQQYLRGTGVRCGPQSEPILWIRPGPSALGIARAADAARGKPQQSAVVATTVTATTRIAPRHVVQNRINTRNVSVPRGYKKVWEDGRLNPYRAEQNLAGRADMLLVWTQTVPRRLINQATGRDVTATVPLIYPYTNVAQQRREVGEVNIVQRDGQILKRIVRNKGVTSKVRKPVYSTRSAPKTTAVKPAARSAPKTASGKALASKQYVQVGTFRNAGNAQRTAQNIARMGMPARIGKHRKGGQKYMTVQAGPFTGAKAMQAAMKRLRGAGYKDAFAR